MTKRMKKYSGRLLATAGVTAVLGALVWALIAYAQATANTYSDATYSTVKTQYGRGVDTVYARMTGGFANLTTYYAEYWGPLSDDGNLFGNATSFHFKRRSAAPNTDASGVGTDSYATQSSDKSGKWQVRFHANPRYDQPCYIVIDSPTQGTRLTTSTVYTFKFHLVDRQGNTITTDKRSTQLRVSSSGTAANWSSSSNSSNVTSANGWAFNADYTYSKNFTSSATAGTIAYFEPRTRSGLAGAGIEPGDTYAMDTNTNGLYTRGYYMTGSNSSTYPYTIRAVKTPITQQFPNFGNPAGGTTIVYDYYFDILNVDGNPITSGTFTWTRTAKEARDYDSSGAQTTVTGSTPAYDSASGHWKCTFTLPAPGKYMIDLRASSTNTPREMTVINFGATSGFTMLGDVTPPANVSGLTATPSNARVTLNWTNPNDTDFNGVMVLRDTNSITAVPAKEQVYSTDGSNGPNTIGTARVVYYGTGLTRNGAGSLVNGDPCIPAESLINGQVYYYKVYTFDMPLTLNYSAGSQVSATPSDTTPPGPVSGVGFVEGNQQVTINWIYPSDCDIQGAKISFRTDTYPSKADGSDCEGGASAQLSANGAGPDGPGTYLHQNLVNGRAYYYTIWTYDKNGNLAPDAQGVHTPAGAVPHDVVPPAAVDDLQISTVPGSVGSFTIKLVWSSVGNDGRTGQAYKYDIRYANKQITENIDDATHVSWKNAWHVVGQLPTDPLPGVPSGGQPNESYTVAGLAPLTHYYFAIKTEDNAGNWATISTTTPNDTTLCNQQIDGCNQCHLLPPDDDLPGAHPRGTGNIGAHYLPIHAGNGTSPEQCNVCHANGQVWRNGTTLYKYTHQNDKVDMNNASTIGNLKERQNKTGGTWHAMTTIVFKYKNYSSGVGYKVTTGYCTNTYCHGGGLSSPMWGLGTATCGEYCHETPPATGKHVKHYHPGLRYINFGPAGTQVSGYENDNGSTANGWSATLSTGTSANPDLRYGTYVSSSNAVKTFTSSEVPNGSYYLTFCVGRASGTSNGQAVSVSTDGGATYVPVIDSFNTSALKLFKKAVDHQVIVYGNNGLKVRIGNGGDLTYLNFMILNPTPEAPKSNTTLLQNTPTEYGFACGKCHVMDIAQAKHTSHVNGAVEEGVRDAEVFFDGNSFPKNPLGNYTDIFGNATSKVDGQGFRYTTGSSCENLYCHGNTLNAGGSNTTPHWTDGYIDVEGASICGSCHDAGYGDTTPNTTIGTGSHSKHVNRSYVYRFDCAKCHNHTVGFRNPTTGAIKIVDKTHHVNGDVDVIFDPNDPSMRLGRYSTSQKTCYSVYCHSNGLLNNADQPFWATAYREPVWASGSKTCNYCHGTSRSDGMPSYSNNTTTPNSHSAHVDTNKLGCSKCHYNTTRDNGATIYTTMQPSLHVNRQADVTFDPENPSGYYSHVNLQCTNTYCHGRTAAPTWGGWYGGGVTCGSCHGQSPTDPNPGIGAHNVHNAGNHGNISTIDANKSTAMQYDFDCRFCHFSRTHGGGEAIPGQQTAEVNFNTIDVTNAYNNTGGTYTRATARTDAFGWHYSGGTCSTKCHSDGRGGAPNKPFISWTATAGTLGCAGCHNGDATQAQKMSTNHHPKHVWSSIYRKACGDCHAATATGSDVISNKTNHVNGRPDVQIAAAWNAGSTYTNKNCNNVYCHSNGDPSTWKGTQFYKMINWTSSTGSTCTTCHASNHVVGGDGTRTETQTLSFNHREHLNPYNDAQLPGYGSRIGCTNCHNGTAASNTSLQGRMPTMHDDSNKDIFYYVPFFNMTGPNTMASYTTSGTYTAYWGSYNTPVPGNCTVICHSDARGGNPLRFPNWSTPEGTYGCASCHAADPATFALPNYTAKSFAHVTHLNNGLVCNTCHRLTAGNNSGTPFINASGFTTHHVNGSAANDVKLSVAGSYATATKTCSGLACHGDRVWTTHYASNCSSCHEAPPRYSQHFGHYSATLLGNLTGVKSNSNLNKSTSTNYMFGCGKCHDATQTHHNQGNVSTYQTAEVKFDSALAPANGLGSYTSNGALLGTDARLKTYTNGVCRNLYCHSNGQLGAFAKYSSIHWGATSVTCTSCHGGADVKANVSLSAPHGTHVGTNFANLACINCHKLTVSSNTAIANKFNHVNGTKDVSFQAFGSVTGFYTASQTCRNTYCHSDGNGGTAATPTWAVTGTTCTSCHNYTVASGSPITTGKHGQHINNGQLGSFICANCHDKTVDGGAIKYSTGYHVNGVKNVNFTSIMTNISGFYTSASKTCRNNYCHSSGQASSGTLPNRSTPVFRVTSSWSTASGFGCNSCHGRDNGQSAYGEPNYANRSTASRAWFNGHAKHVKSSADCQTCHNATVDTTGTAIIAGGYHINGSRDVNFKNGGSYNTATKRCSGTACHVGTVRWGGRLSNDCQSCHSDMGAGSYANHSSTGKHVKHTNATTYAFACEVCHVVRDPSGDTTHAGGDVSTKHAAEVKFRSTSSVWRTLTYGSGGTAFRYIGYNAMYGAAGVPAYTPWTTQTALSDPLNTNRKWTQGRCSNVWCHSNANPVGGTNSYQTYANWSTAETTSCASCHGTATSNTLSSKHQAHVNNGTLGSFRCAQCHRGTVSTNTAIRNYLNHVNGVKNVNFSSIMPNVTGFYTGTRTCRNNYCHSSGQATSGTLPNRSTPVFRTAAAWDGATTYTCNACHGQDNGPSTYGEPNYANRSTVSKAWFNGHYVSGHVSSQASCFKCHANVVASDGITILANGNHLNGFRNVSFTLGGKYDTVNKRCSNTDAGCHGANVMRWGGTGTCDTCHQTTATEVDDFVYGNHTTATINFYAYTSVGHGKLGRYRYSNHTGAASVKAAGRAVTACTTCHSASVAHGSGTNPFRLVSSMTTTGVCANCHSASQASHHSAAVMSGDNSTWVFTPKCVDCHDPHGDVDPNHAGRFNAYMIQSYVNYTSNSTNGVPAGYNGKLRKAVSFPANANLPTARNWTSYVTSSFTGLCQICHTRGAAPTSPDWYNRSLYNTLHNNNLSCGQCHAHGTGFTGSGNCNDCHQTTGAETDNYTYGNGQKATVNYYEYTSVGHGKMGRYRYTNNTGAAGTLNANRKITGCASCHSSSVAHNTTWNPFRTLSTATEKPSSPDTLCAKCHAASEASGHKFGITTSNATWVFTPKCVDCHDPHGDTGANGRYNNAMVQGFVNYSANSNTYGVPTATKGVSFPANVTLPANLNYTSYATNTQTGGSYTGICQICHTKGNPPTSPDWFARDKNLTVHNNNLSCGQCHKHPNGFSRSGACTDCHQTTAAETDDFVYHNLTRATINYYQYTSVGHGKIGKYLFTSNTGAANPVKAARQVTGCTTCHSSAINHGSATDPFRTISSSTVRPSSPDTLCASCHSAAQAFRHSSSISGSDANWPFFPKCVDCHDPHGDDNTVTNRRNYAMIQGLLNYTSASNAYGVPAGTNGSLRRPVSFPANPTLPVSLNRSSFTVYVMTGNAYTGLCQICHTRGAIPTSPDHFNRGKVDTSHNSGQACDTCHTHDTGFAGAGGTCDSCHGVTTDATTETDNYVYNNGTKATINLLQYTSVGHGKLGRYRYSNNTGAAGTLNAARKISACTSCHDNSVAHGKATNPFRLISTSTRKPAVPDTICGYCHTGSEASSHKFGNTSGSATWLFTPKCVDCHDPHGDADPNHAGRMNAYMIQRYVNYSTNSSAYGVPNYDASGSPTLVKSVSFPANASLPGWNAGTVKMLGYTSYATNTQTGGSYTGICQVCHTRGNQPTSPLWFGRDKNATVHNSGSSCESCHAHGTGFTGTAACTTCHQTTGTETDNFVFGDNNKATINFDQYTSVGHGKIGKYLFTNNTGAANPAKGSRQVTSCTSCHKSSVGHGVATNPFRLVSSVMLQSGVCANCHTTAQANHHNSTNTGGNATWVFTPKCVDCHDPHGDNGPNGRHNNAMIQGYVNYTSNSSNYGVPAGNGSLTKAVNFPGNVALPANLNYTSFARSNFTGLCQICHTRGVAATQPGGTSPIHYNRALYEDQTGHSGGAVCISCHTHPSGFKGSGDCTTCHGTGGSATGTSSMTTHNKRRDIQREFTLTTSHHMQGLAWGTTLTKKECSACHAEGDSNGTTTTLHTGQPGHPVYLKNWTSTFRTTDNRGYSVISTTALTRSTGNTYVLTPFCLGCHSEKNAAATPFNDGKNPEAYSWDGNSVASKYSNVSTTPWGKFNSTLYNVVPADMVTKSFSPHGNAGQNRMAKGIATFGTYSATSDVQCYDCHNTHGSNVGGGTSYASINDKSGGILKCYSTQGGADRNISVRYLPRATSGSTKNNAASSSTLCFDCHLGESSTNEPKDYRNYGIPTGKAIVGYYDRVGVNYSNYSTSRWSTSDTWRGSFPYKDAAFKGGHFGNSMGFTEISGMGTKINEGRGGKCVMCHDPHGVSPIVKRGITKVMQTVKHTGTTGSPTVGGSVASGDVNQSRVVVLQITAGGTQANSQFRYSTDGGKTWTNSNNTNGQTTILTSVNINWNTGNYYVNDTWSFMVGANPTFMVPALKGTWMHSPYKEDRAPRNDHSVSGGRLANVPRANDFTDYNPTMDNRRLWDDVAGGTSAAGTNRGVGGPAPRANPDFRAGSYVPGYNIPAVQGDGFGQGPAGKPGRGKFYGYSTSATFGNVTTFRGWNGYFIDENTFGTFALKSRGASLPFRSMTGANPAAMPGNFGGLCLQCHVWAKNSGVALSNVTSGNLGTGAGRNTAIPHETVLGMNTNGMTVDLWRRMNNGTGTTTYSTNYESAPYARGLHGASNISESASGSNGAYYGAAGRWGTSSGGVTDPTAYSSSPGSSSSHSYRWGVLVSSQRTNGYIQKFYHRFPCAKCHTPHVSRLPRLMKTNCLDNDSLNSSSVSSMNYAHTTMAYANVTSSSLNASYKLWGAIGRNVACHATKTGITSSSSPYFYPGGWNNKTPW